MFKNFRLNILFRIILISILIGLILYFVFVNPHYLRSLYIGLFLIVVIVEFFYYTERTNRDFASFLMALLQNDFTTTFSESTKGRSFNKLYRAFNLITKRFKKISSAKQAQHIYLETLVEHVQVGIISFDQNEKIQLMNSALKNMLGKTTLLYLKSLQTVNEEFVNTLRVINPGEHKLIKVNINNNLLQLAIHASAFKLEEATYKLISVQNIKNELESNELDAWQKLIRVLTHEIMNSVTPISSLTDTLGKIVADENQKEKPSATILPKLQQGLEAIKTRSEGLESFTTAYRSLTRIPPPVFTTVSLNIILDRIKVLLAQSLEKIDFKISTPNKEIEVLADQSMLEQVFINLIKNAIEATVEQESPIINITISKLDQTIIEIADNGSGIAEDKIDQIFVPFFTTKTTGSGIGLAISRQIIHLHNGSINVKSYPNSGTTFIIAL